MDTICETTDLPVFSNLRWKFVFQRPQHLISLFAKYRRASNVAPEFFETANDLSGYQKIENYIVLNEIQ